MRFANAVTAALAGVAAVTLVAPVLPVSVALALGSVVAAAITWRGDTERYGLTGAVLLLGVGTLVLVTEWFPAAWGRTPLVALWLFGLLSVTVVVAKAVLGVVGRRVVAAFVDDENADSVWDALSAFAGTLFLAWSVMTAQEKAVRTGGVAVGGTSTMALDTLGYDLPVLVPFVHEALTVTVRGYELSVPLWLLENGIGATMIVFVGCVIVGFHTLGTLAATWRAVKDTTGFASEKMDEAGDTRPAAAGPGTRSGPAGSPSDQPRGGPASDGPSRPGGGSSQQSRGGPQSGAGSGRDTDPGGQSRGGRQPGGQQPGGQSRPGAGGPAADTGRTHRSRARRGSRPAAASRTGARSEAGESGEAAGESGEATGESGEAMGK